MNQDSAGCTTVMFGFIAGLCLFVGIIMGFDSFDFNTYECTKICPSMGESIRYKAECYCKTTSIETP